MYEFLFTLLLPLLVFLIFYYYHISKKKLNHRIKKNLKDSKLLIKEIEICAREDYEKIRYDELIRESYEGMKLKTFWQTYWFILYFIVGCSIILVIWGLLK